MNQIVKSVTLAIYLLVSVPTVTLAQSSNTAKNAFAKVQRDGKPYKAFYNYYISPHAIEEKGHVYVAFQDGRGRPVLMAYNKSSRKWTDPVRASDFGLGKDTHGNPSICIDNKGFIHIFFGCHGRAMKHIRSTLPYNINKWQDMPSPTPKATYPQTMRMHDGRIFLFYRAGGHMEPWSLRISSDNCKTWSEPEKIVEMRLDPPDRLAAAYCAFMPGAGNKTVHCFYVHKDDNPTRVKVHPWRPLIYPGLHEAVYRYNVYYIRRNMTGKWTGAHGRTVDLPLSRTESDFKAMIFDSGNEFASTKRMVIGSDNRPYIRFSVGVEDWKTGKTVVPYKTWFASPVDSQWTVTSYLPQAWPHDIQDLIKQEGPSAYGGSSPNPWNIFFHSGTSRDPSATYIWLRHIKDGYASRKGGPADTGN